MPISTIPQFGAAKTARLVVGFAALALLSACATRPQVTSQVESTQYRQRAARNYTPPGPASDPWGPYIVEAAAKYDVPERWIREVMRQESGGRMYGRGGDLITSGAGAMGLMQVMPGTYDELRGRYSELGDDAFDPRNNIMAGTAYIREMYDIYGSPGFLAAYNAGPGRLDDYLTRNRTLPEETRRYVASIGPRLTGEPNRPSPGAQYAVNSLPMRIGSGSRYASAQRYSAPSAPIVLAAQPAWPTPAAAPVAAPVQVAQAEPARGGSFIRLTPQPAWAAPPVPGEEPAGPLSIAPVQVAAAAPSRAPYITLRPQPLEVAQAPEYVRPEPARAEPGRIVQAATLPAPPTPVFAAARAPQFAQLPEPPRMAAAPFRELGRELGREPGRSQQQLAAAALVPASPRSFGLVSSAFAEPIRPRTSGLTTGNWAIQVGAFANEGLAASATAAARDHARDVLAPARSSVTPVRQPHGVLYRARLNGLSRDSAAHACERLSRARTTCVVVSPDAQS